MGSWFRGICHEVPNGDTLVINATSSSPPGPPPQKRIVLASLVAPKMVRQQPITDCRPSFITSIVQLKPVVLVFLIKMVIVQARRDGQDEPFAWASREFLRKKAIGQVSTPFTTASKHHCRSDPAA